MWIVLIERSLLGSWSMLARVDAGGGKLARRRRHHDHTSISSNGLALSRSSLYRNSLRVHWFENPGLSAWIRVLIVPERISRHLELGVGLILQRSTGAGRAWSPRELDMILYLMVCLGAARYMLDHQGMHIFKLILELIGWLLQLILWRHLLKTTSTLMSLLESWVAKFLDLLHCSSFCILQLWIYIGRGCIACLQAWSTLSNRGILTIEMHRSLGEKVWSSATPDNLILL